MVFENPALLCFEPFRCPHRPPTGLNLLDHLLKHSSQNFQTMIDKINDHVRFKSTQKCGAENTRVHKGLALELLGVCIYHRFCYPIHRS